LFFFAPPFNFNIKFLKTNLTFIIFYIFFFCSFCCLSLWRNSGFLFFLRALSFKYLTVGLRLTGFLVAKCLANVVSSSAFLISLFSNASRAFAIAKLFLT
jgi:ABC-type multidrug transport system permease subunit